MSERLSFEPVPEPPEGQNRLFIIVAIGLVGMLVLGLLGIGGYVVFSRTKRATRVQQPTPLVVMAATSTPTIMATSTPIATATATVRPTNTPVVLPPTPTAVVVVVQTSPMPTTLGRATTAAQPAQAGQPAEQAGGQQEETTPSTGFGLGAMGLGAGLAAVVFAARRLRMRK